MRTKEDDKLKNFLCSILATVIALVPFGLGIGLLRTLNISEQVVQIVGLSFVIGFFTCLVWLIIYGVFIEEYKKKR